MSCRREHRRASGRSKRSQLAGCSPESGACYGATDLPLDARGCAPLRSLTSGSWKYIRSTRPELYDLAADPAERHDLSVIQPKRLEEMESLMRAFEGATPPRDGTGVQLSANERIALDSLGYAFRGPAAPPMGLGERLPDIKDVLPYDAAYWLAIDLLQRDSPIQIDSAIRILREIASHSPHDRWTRLALASALEKGGDAEAAAEALVSLVEAEPGCSVAHYRLGLLLEAAGRADAALTAFENAVAGDPAHPSARLKLAEALCSAGNFKSALEHLDAALSIDALHAAAYEMRGKVLLRGGRTADAVSAYEEFVRLVPGRADGHYDLGMIHFGNRSYDQAARSFSRALELAPRNAVYNFALGRCMVAQQEYDAAIVSLARAIEIEPRLTDAERSLREARKLWRRRQCDGTAARSIRPVLEPALTPFP